MRAKSQSNKAEPTSVSMILWIAFAVIIVLAVGGLIFNALRENGEDLAECMGGMVRTAIGAQAGGSQMACDG